MQRLSAPLGSDSAGSPPLPLTELYLPWPARRNAAAADHEARAREIAAGFGLLAADADQPDARRFQGFVEIDSYVYPDASPERLAAAGAFNQWLYFIDDQYDEHPEIGHDAIAVRRLMERAVEVLQTAEVSPDATPFDRFSQHLRRTLDPLAPEGWLPRFLVDVEAYLFRGSLAAMEYWSRGVVPPTPEYLSLRMFDSALFPAIDLVEVANDVRLPFGVHAHPLVRELRIRCARHVAYVNDIFSYHKEVVRNGTPFNLVHVLMANDHLPLAEAVRRATAIANDDMRRFVAAEAALPSFGPAADAELARYVDGMKTWMRGNVDFSAQSRRFRPDPGAPRRPGDDS